MVKTRWMYLKAKQDLNYTLKIFLFNWDGNWVFFRTFCFHEQQEKNVYELKHVYLNLIIGQRPYIASQSNLENMRRKWQEIIISEIVKKSNQKEILYQHYISLINLMWGKGPERQ